MKRKGILRGLTGLAILAGLCGAGYFLFLPVLRPEVAVAPVERGNAVDAVPGVVGVSAQHTVEVRAEAAGRVTERRVEAGSRVEAGDVLFRLDPGELEMEKARVRIELEAEEALRQVGSLLRYDLEEAEDELAHARELHEDGQYSRRDLETAERRVARLRDEIRRDEIRERRRVRTLEQELERLERELEKTVVRAPMEGDVVETHAHPGDVVGPRAPLARLLSSERRVEATVSEEAFAGIRTGQRATVRFLSYGPRVFDATVSGVLPAADPDTQRYTVRLDVEIDEELLVPGITGEVSITRDEREDTRIIPRRALFGRQVFVVRDGRVELREVEPGYVGLNRAEILSGLEETDYVAVENLDRIRDGDRVRIRGL